MTNNLLSETQLARAEVLYVTQERPPLDVAAILNAEFEHEGLTIKPRQITEIASHRKWNTKRKEHVAKKNVTAARAIITDATTLAQTKSELLAKHQEFVDRSVRVGSKALEKAEQLIERTQSPRDLSSAINAAAKGIEIVRRATGMDGTPGSGSGTVTNNFYNFARSEGSPFAKKVSPETLDSSSLASDAAMEAQSEVAHR